MPIMPDGTTSEDEIIPSLEQAAITPLASDSKVVIPDEPVVAPAKVEPEKVEPPADPRAARMEALAEKTRENATEELALEQETLTPVAERQGAAAAAAAPAERMITIKVRGQEVQLPESEVIARAQKTDAADTYLAEARQLYEDAKKVSRGEPAPAKVDPVVPEPKVDRIAKAVEAIQLGESVDSIRDMLADEIKEQAREVARTVNEEDRGRTRSSNFDADEGAGFAQFQKDHPEVAKDPIAANVIMSVTRSMEAEVIARFLTDAPEAVRNSFASANITADGVRAYKPDDVHALFKDMHLKGYALHRPSAIIKAAGDTVATRFGATTKAADPVVAATPAVLDRTTRKAAIQQPIVAAIPRPTAGTPAPKNEAERANQSRAELRAERRAGVARA